MLNPIHLIDPFCAIEHIYYVEIGVNSGFVCLLGHGVDRVCGDGGRVEVICAYKQKASGYSLCKCK